MKWSFAIGAMITAAIISTMVFMVPSTQDGAARREPVIKATVLRDTTPVAAPALTELPDSVRLVLFAGFHVDRLVVHSSSKVRVNNSTITQRDSIIIACSGSELLLNGQPPVGAEIVLHSSQNSSFHLTAAERTRELQGVLHVYRSGKFLRIIADVDRDDYLAAVLASETSLNDPMEYLVAVSVLQRNYLQSHSERHLPDAAMCDNTHCQVAFLKPVSGRVYEAVHRASVIQVQAEGTFPCYYSGCCGGSTITPGQIWRHSEPGYTSVQCRNCANSRWYRWKRTVAATPEIDRLMRSAPAAPFLDDDFKMRIGRVIGFNVVVSNTVRSIVRRGHYYVVEGSGFGHRIGLCQEGACQMARHGRSAEEILRFYFPTADITNGIKAQGSSDMTTATASAS